MRLLFVLAMALVASVHAIASASAQTYPSRAVKFILPFGPGSGADITTRLLSDKLATRWGKPVIIENRPGGDGLVAINAFIARQRRAHAAVCSGRDVCGASLHAREAVLRRGP